MSNPSLAVLAVVVLLTAAAVVGGLVARDRNTRAAAAALTPERPVVVHPGWVHPIMAAPTRLADGPPAVPGPIEDPKQAPDRGRHAAGISATELVSLHAPTCRLKAVPGPSNPVQPARTGTATGRVSGSGGHRAVPGRPAQFSGSRLASPR